MKNFLKPSLALLFASTLLVSCDNDDDNPTPENEQELITTLTLTMTPRNGGNAVTATYNDPDGDGGTAPTISNVSLVAGKTYDVSLQVMDQSKTPAENITEEIEEESDEHQFFYVASSGLGLTVAYNDKDENNLPIGLKTILTTTAAASNGTLQVVLKHQPDLKSSTSTITTGETDVDVSFPVSIVSQ